MARAKASIKDILNEEVKVKVRLPKAKTDKAENFVPVCINGYVYQVMRGVSVEVPETVAKILEESGYLD